MFYTINSIKPIVQKLRQQGKKIVLATGFFDLLHAEHQNFLQSAKKIGDILIVAVESDARARALKGEGRPIETQSLRCQHLLDGHFADYVIALGDDFDNPSAYESLIAATQPAIYAISSHTNHQDTKSRLVAKYGGKLLVVHLWNPNISTTKLIQAKKV